MMNFTVLDFFPLFFAHNLSACLLLNQIATALCLSLFTCMHVCNSVLSSMFLFSVECSLLWLLISKLLLFFQAKSSSAGDVHRRRSSLESLFCYDKAIPEERIEKPIGISLAEKVIGENPRCTDCKAKGAVLCTTCSGSGLYVDSILESQGIIVKVRCLGKLPSLSKHNPDNCMYIYMDIHAVYLYS